MIWRLHSLNVLSISWECVSCEGAVGWSLGGRTKVEKKFTQASLVAQWLRVCLPMQGTRVRALVWEDPTCRGATRPVSHNC